MGDNSNPLAALLVLALLALFVWCLVRFAANVGGGFRDGDAARELDKVFNGSQRVRYTVKPSSLKYETVMDSARERGYCLVDKDDRRGSQVTLTFDRCER